MPSYQWIKVYHEVLHDPKMERLPDHLWRRALECFLMAGEQEEDGYLPSIADMAWKLRTTEDDLTADFEQLSAVNILDQRDGRWYVSHFAERQAARTDAERMADMRERRRKQEYYGGVTSDHGESYEPVTIRNREKSRIEKSRVDIGGAEKKPHPKPPKEPLPPAVEIYRRLAELYPPKALFMDIDRVVGRDPPALDFWAQVIKGWLGMGWKKVNVSGMLEFFGRHEIPQSKGNGRRNGQREEHPDDDADAEIARRAERDRIERERYLAQLASNSAGNVPALRGSGLVHPTEETGGTG